MKRPLYLSPHPDDAVLSCGGLIYHQANRGLSPLIITLFAGTPDYTDVSPFARVQHGYWGNPPDPMALRRQEDATAAQRLGARLCHLPFLDAVYRADSNDRPLYPSEEAIFGDIAPEDEGLVDQLTGCLTSLCPPQAQLYLPLAAGHHVDHLVARAAAENLGHDGITFYEDFPYVARADEAVWQGQVTVSLRPQTERLDDDALQAKLEAISCYASQLDILFGGTARMRTIVTGYGRRQAGNTAAAGERYWIPEGACASSDGDENAHA